MLIKKLLFLIVLSLLFTFTVFADVDDDRDPSHPASEIRPYNGITDSAGWFYSRLTSSQWLNKGSFNFENTTLYIHSLVKSITEIPFDARTKFSKTVTINATIANTPHLNILNAFLVDKTIIKSYLPFQPRSGVYLGTGCEASSPTLSRVADSVIIDLGTPSLCIGGAECQTALDCSSGTCSSGICSS